jgi:hypothetical protein
MEHADLLQYMARTFEQLGVAYLITGSTATIFFGEARFTTDIDVVAKLSDEHVPALMKAFPPTEYYLSEAAARTAIRTHGQFNIIHPESGLKIDVMVPADTAFNRARLARARKVRPGEYEASFASMEDVILKKLEYYQDGGSDKHLRDIAGVFKISGEQIDREYISEWAERLNLKALWDEMQARLNGG